MDSKIAEVRRTSNSTKKNLRFDYDAMGNRIAKHIYTDNTFTLLEKSTYYVRDASGNVMAVYDRIIDASVETGEFMLSERHIYGSSRIGMDVSTHVFGPDPYTALTETTRELGRKQYEISNHLGNVLSVITDQKLPVVVDSLIVSYSAVVVTATDYSPFGVGLYGRSWSGEYRYGFNGQELDNYVSGYESHYSAEFWQYDALIGRRWQLDPLTYPWNSGYLCFNNIPIRFSDSKGLEGEDNVGPPKDAKLGDNWTHTDANGSTWSYTLEDCGWVGTGGSANLKEVEIVAERPSWFESIVNTTIDYISSVDVVFELSGRLDVGAQAKVKGNCFGLNGELDVNLCSFELASGRVDFTELGSNNPDAYSGNIIGDGTGTKVTQRLGATVGFNGKDYLGGQVTHTFKTHGQGYFDQDVDYGVYLIVPVLTPSKAKDIEPVNIKDMNMPIKPEMSRPRAGLEKSFVGVDIGIAAAFILGVDVNLKLGFKR